MSDELRHDESHDVGADTERFRKFASSEESAFEDAAPAAGGLPVRTLAIVVAFAVVLLLVAVVLLR
ncbi:MAG: hypothetical protein GEU81_00185 [Nitriliruptorales bacterium]|nr:hypothetical protein [Nitriliruptorales bacterium]